MSLLDLVQLLFLVMKGTRALELAPKYKVSSRVSFHTRFCPLGFFGFFGVSFPVCFMR
jgi:hypothetical protein